MTKQVQVRLHGIETYVDDSVVDSYTAGIQHHADALLPLLDYAGSILKPDDLVFDVGANIGLTTIGLARLVPDGSVLAFEPSSLNAERLRRNLAANNITNVDIVEAAVSSHDGGLHFVDTVESGSASHVLPFTSDTNVRSVALDAHRHTRKDGRGPAFIKIDVEGHEPWVLDSGARLIGECRPILWMEFNSWCLMAFGSINPLEFAEALFGSFSVRTTTDGKNIEPISDYVSFAHRNLVNDGCVTDVILQARDEWPSQTKFAGGEGEQQRRDLGSRLQSTNAVLLQRCSQLEAEIRALKRSTSWRVTRPLRTIKRRISSATK